MSSLDIYGPCSCGSGKKLKFCCYQKAKDLDGLSNRELSIRANQFPVTKCFINGEWEEQGIAQVYVVRHLLNRKFIVGIYLVDTFCLGLKDSFIRSRLSEKELYNLSLQLGDEMEEISYEDARSIIFGAIEFAQGYGFTVKDDEGALNIVEADRDFENKFIFGREGKPFYFQGPHDDVASIMEKLQPHLDTKNAHFVIGADLSSSV